MKKMKMSDLWVAIGMVVLCCSMTACTSLQGQMDSYDSDIEAQMEASHWNAAKRIIDAAEFRCEPGEQEEVKNWRSREHIKMKNAFSKTLQPTVLKAQEFWQNGAFAEGDKVRLSLKDKYYGNQGGAEPVKLLSLKLFDAGTENGVPECLAPCIELAWVQMLSDRNIARMITSYKGYCKQMAEIDVNGGKKSIKQFDAIAAGSKKVEKWKDKIDLFMEMLASPDTRRWAPIDRSQYALTIKKMEETREAFLKQFRTKRWNTRVLDRKSDYKKIEELSIAKNYQEAMQILSSHDLLVKPEGLEGVMDFDDQAERARVASNNLGEEVVKQLFESGLSGVRYERRNANHGMGSMLIVGRVQIEDKTNRRKLREAGRVAQMQARSEFVRYLGTFVSSKSEAKSTEVDDEAHQSFSSIENEKAGAEVSNLVVLATGVERDEVVVVLGWRNPNLGTITPVPMHRVKDKENFTVSPSVGAYL